MRFTHRGILATAALHIHPLYTEAHNQTEAKTNTARAGKYSHHLWVTSAFGMTVKWPPLFPLLFPAFNLAVWRRRRPPVSSLPPSPSHIEIAVVSYGFLFLRDGRWVHVGVEATKHAARAQPAHGNNSRHVGTSGPANTAAEREKRGFRLQTDLLFASVSHLHADFTRSEFQIHSPAPSAPRSWCRIGKFFK